MMQLLITFLRGSLWGNSPGPLTESHFVAPGNMRPPRRLVPNIFLATWWHKIVTRNPKGYGGSKQNFSVKYSQEMIIIAEITLHSNAQLCPWLRARGVRQRAQHYSGRRWPFENSKLETVNQDGRHWTGNIYLLLLWSQPPTTFHSRYKFVFSCRVVRQRVIYFGIAIYLTVMSANWSKRFLLLGQFGYLRLLCRPSEH